MSQPHRETMKLWDGEISYLEWEGAGPPLLFSHATGFNAETYRVLLQSLSDRFHIFAEDQRGHGFNSLPTTEGIAKGWTIYRDDVVRFLDGFDGRPMILAGHSMGATISVMAALLRPDLVRGLVLVEPVFMSKPGGFDMRWLIKWRLGLTGGDQRSCRRARQSGAPNSIPSLDFVEDGLSRARRVHDMARSDAARLSQGRLAADRRYRTLAARLPAPTWESETFRSTPFGITGKVKPLRCPVTIIYGGLSSTCSDEEAAIFATQPQAHAARTHRQGDAFSADGISRGSAQGNRPHVTTGSPPA